MKSPKEYYDNYARHYASTATDDRLPNDLVRLRRDRMPKWLDGIPVSAKILDIGCAQGHMLAGLERLGYTDLTGVDISEQLLADARKIVSPNVTLLNADLIDFLDREESEKYDLIFFYDVLEHIPREHTLDVLRKIKEKLKPDGILSCRVPNMSCIIGGFNAAIDFTHVVNFTEFSLVQVFEAAGYSASNIEFDSQAPRLFLSFQRPIKCLFRFLNYLRWTTNRLLHRLLYLMVDVTPPPKHYDRNIQIRVWK